MRPLVIGHRGFAARFPDNSLAGVQAAFAAGADGVEVDVRPCAGGTWVCHHDRTRASRPVAAWRLDELRRGGVPTLAEVVAAASGWLFVEVKPLPQRDLHAALPELVSLLAPRAATTRVISSSLPVLAAIDEALPGIATSWVFGEMPAWLPLGLELSPAHRFVEDLVAAGRRLHPWTVNRAPRVRELARLGVASVTTNHPDMAREALGG